MSTKTRKPKSKKTKTTARKAPKQRGSKLPKAGRKPKTPADAVGFRLGSKAHTLGIMLLREGGTTMKEVRGAA